MILGDDPIHDTHDSFLPDYVLNIVDPSLRCLFPFKVHIFFTFFEIQYLIIQKQSLSHESGRK